VPDIDDRGPLGLSDPGSVEQGKAAKEVKAEESTDSDAPAKKAAAKRTAKKS
jgi:hypothetical protein